MAKTKAMNVSCWRIAAVLLLCGLTVVVSGCASPTGLAPFPSWQTQSAPSSASSQTTPPRAAPSTAPAPGTSPANVTLRGQGAWDAYNATPGAGDHWRGPMPVSGDGTQQAPPATPQAGTGQPTRYVAYQASNQVPGPGPAPTNVMPPGTLPGQRDVLPPVPPAGQVVPSVAAPTVPGTSSNGIAPWVTSPLPSTPPAGWGTPPEELQGTSVPIEVTVEEARTGRFMFGAGVNSEAGVTGQIVVDERNFNLFGFPRSMSDVWNGEAFRGAGQGFRLEAVPGTIVQRYLVSFTEPYLLSTPISLNVSGFYYDRRYYDWDENRLGGRLGLGYRLTPDLSVSGSARAERVKISDPRVLGVPALDEVLGTSNLYSGKASVRHDTRDLPFIPTEGHLIELSFEQAFGDFNYPRAEFDYRRYFLIRERPDGSGRHTLSFSLGAGFSGAQTPIFENYFAGGFSTLRGFEFRGASPIVNSVTVGGQFRMLGSVQYTMPLTADDMIKAVAFVDFGTVEREIELHQENFRVAPGFGFRIAIPAMGPAPLAFDFAFPIMQADGDETQVFSFFFGFGRG